MPRPSETDCRCDGTPSSPPDRLIYVRHELVDASGDSHARCGEAVLLEGAWPRDTPPKRARALDQEIDARFDWIDQEAVRLAGVVGAVAPSTTSEVITPARLNELALRYYFVKLIRPVVYFVEISPLLPGQRIRLVAQPGRDHDYVDLITNLCRVAAAECCVKWIDGAGSAGSTFAGNRWWRRWAGRVTRLFDSGVSGSRAARAGRIVLCGNPRLLDPIGRKLAARQGCLWWLYDRFAAKSWLLRRPRGIKQLCCDSSLGRENRLTVPEVPPLECGGIDFSRLVRRWLTRRLQTHAARQTRMVEQIDTHFRRLRPHRLVLDEDATPLARAAVAVARAYGARSFVVQHGAPISRFGFAPLWADEILAWGQSSRRQFVRWGVPEESIKVIGSASHGTHDAGLAVASHKPSSKGPTRSEHRKPSFAGKRLGQILLLGTVPPSDDRPDVVQLHLTRRTYADMLRVALAAVAKLPHLRLIVKLHPRAPHDPIARQVLAEFPRVASRMVTGGRLERWLAGTDCVLSCISSSGVEAAATGVPVIQLLPAGCGDVLPHHEWGFLGSARTESELDQLLANALDDEARLRAGVSRRVFANVGDAAAAGIADTILAAEKRGSPQAGIRKERS